MIFVCDNILGKSVKSNPAFTVRLRRIRERARGLSVPSLSCKDRFSKIGIRNDDKHIFACVDPLILLKIGLEKKTLSHSFTHHVCVISSTLTTSFHAKKQRCLKFVRKSSTTGCHSPSIAYKTLSALAKWWEMLIRKVVFKKAQANLYIVHTRYTQTIIKTTIGKKTSKTLICKCHSISKCGVNHTLFRFVQYKLFYPHFLRREKETNCIVFFR